MNPLLRNYKVRALAANGDSSLLVTESRERAVSYYQTLAAGKHWAEVRIELGNSTFTKENLETMP